MHAINRSLSVPTRTGLTVLVGLAALGLAAATASANQTTFKSPQLAMRALVEAAQKNDAAKLKDLGPQGDDLVESGDPVEDANGRKRFVSEARTGMTFEPLAEGVVVARLSRDDWPFPVPLLKDGDTWRFDTAAGKEEVLNRRIGRDELSALAVCRAYVDAQRDYAKVDRTGAGARTYAQKVRSEAGKKDGLYWDDPSGKDQSPFGPLVAEASGEGYGQATAGEPRPYHGYYYRILTAQGAKSPGGARSYLKDGKMTGGFALIAWPANYGNSGIMTFIVNQDGIVFQKNLGEKTAEVAKAMTAYDPDDSWDPAL